MANRPAAVTSSIVLLCLAGAVSLALAVLGSGALLFAGNSAEIRRAAPAPFGALLFLPYVLLAGVGVWAFVTAGGLRRMKRWARISVLIFAGWTVFFGASLLLGLVVALGTTSQREAAESGAAIVAVLAVFGVCGLAVVAVGTWWLVYYNRRAVKPLFAEGRDVPSTPLLGVRLLAWTMVLCGPLVLVGLVVSMPVVVLRLIVTGWPAATVYIVTGVITVWIGANLLRWRPRALDHAVYLYGLGCLNGLAFWLPPGTAERNQQMMEAFQQGWGIAYTPEMLTAQPPVWVTAVLGLASCGVPIWYLLARRQQYLKVCAATASTPVRRS